MFEKHCISWDHSFWHDHFGADHFGSTYFVAGPFRHRSFRRQFGALWQFSYLGLVKKHRIGAEKVSAEMVVPKSHGPRISLTSLIKSSIS